MQDVLMSINVPFCVKQCGYCPRTVVEGWDAKRLHAYMEAVKNEVEANASEFQDCRVTAVHWGGGLASMANAQDVSDIMGIVRSRFHVAEDAPVTMRAAIANISGASMPFFKRAGVTRFDFEMMSLFPLGYSYVNKRDSLGDLPVVCDHFLRSYANRNLGIVLLYGLDTPEPDNFRRSVVEFTRLSACHLLLQRARGPHALPEEQAEAQHDEARMLLEEAGFHEYLPRRFARPGEEDRFATLEAAGASCIGFGLGAKTRLDGAVSTTTDDLALYCAASADYAAITADVKPWQPS